MSGQCFGSNGAKKTLEKAVPSDAVGKISTPCTTPSSPQSGIPILPVCYAVVPKTPAFADIQLPASLGSKVTEVALQHHQYVLRVLRQGFIYVYYHGHPDNKQWSIFQVDNNAQLSELDIDAFKQGILQPICSGQAYFFIEKPKEQGRVEFAFSEHQWSKETLDTMESDSALLNRRMQTFRPSVWVNSPQYPHGLAATEDNLKQVLEYSGNTTAYHHLHPALVETQHPSISETPPNRPDKKDLSNKDLGKHNSETLHLNTTQYPASMRSEQRSTLIAEINRAPNQPQHPMILALWDSVGITRELGGFAADAAGWVAQYEKEWALYGNAINNIELAKSALEERAKAFNQHLKDSTDSGLKHDRFYQQLKQSQTLWQTREDRWTQKYHQAQQQNLSEQKRQAIQEKLDQCHQRLEQLRQEIQQHEVESRKIHQQFADNRIARSWNQYRDEISEEAIHIHRGHQQALLDEADTLINQRISDQVAWLESPRLHNALTEFHQDSLIDGRYFEDLVGDIVQTMNSCEAGVKKLDAWVKECAVTEGNLFWRAIASNHSRGKQALDEILAKAKAQQDVVANGDSILFINKDLYARLVDVVKLNADSLEASKAAAQNIPTGGIDKIFTTLGSRLLLPLIKAGTDTVGNVIIRLVYMGKLQMDVEAEGRKLQSQLKELKQFYDSNMTKLTHTMDIAQQNLLDSAKAHPSQRGFSRLDQRRLDKAKNMLRYLKGQYARHFDNTHTSHTDILNGIATSNQQGQQQSRQVMGKPGKPFPKNNDLFCLYY